MCAIEPTRVLTGHCSSTFTNCRLLLCQVYVATTIRVTISIVHDDETVVDTIGPVSVGELKSENKFNNTHGPESVSRDKTFILWRDNGNPQLIVLSMVNKIPNGDPSKRCYRLVVQVQETATSIPTPHVCCPPVVYYDSNNCSKPSTETRFAMASKTPKEANEKIRRTVAAAAANTSGARAAPQPRGRARQWIKPSERRGQKRLRRPMDEPESSKWTQKACTALPATDAAVELVNLLTGQTKPGAPVAATCDGMTRRQSSPPTLKLETQQLSHSVRHSTSDPASVFSNDEATVHATFAGAEATIVQVKTDDAGRVTLGL